MGRLMEPSSRIANSKPIPHIPLITLPFEGVMEDVLKVRPPVKKILRPKESGGRSG